MLSINQRVFAFVFVACLPTAAFPATPENGAAQSFETCSMISSEYITVLQLLNQGFSGEQLSGSLPGLDDDGAARVQTLAAAAHRDGLADTFSAVNSEYARCSRHVYQQRGKPDPASREGHFYFCAGENKLRYEILIAATLDARIDAVLPQIPASREPIARAIFNLQQTKGTLAAFDAIGDELKYCLNGKS